MEECFSVTIILKQGNSVPNAILETINQFVYHKFKIIISIWQQCIFEIKFYNFDNTVVILHRTEILFPQHSLFSASSRVKSLNNDLSPSIYSSLGFCYLQLPPIFDQHWIYRFPFKREFLNWIARLNWMIWIPPRKGRDP